MTPLAHALSAVLGAAVASIVWAVATTGTDIARRRHIRFTNTLSNRLTALEARVTALQTQQARRFTRTQPHPYTPNEQEQ